MAHPLYHLLKGGPKNLPKLGEKQLESFRSLIKAVTEPPVLALPQKGLRYSLDTDASKCQIGCALFQTHGSGERKPLGFWSRSMKPAELNYSVTEQECLAVIYGISTCRHYLIGEEFDLHTDHASLRWLL